MWHPHRHRHWLAVAVGVALSQPRPIIAQQHWRLVEDLRMGGADSGATSFNDIRSLAVDAKGRIFVLDYKTQEIRMFDASGRFVRLVGRTGQGPGEFTEPNGLRIAPDGKLWVNDHANGRFVIFSGDGTFERQILAPAWGYGYSWDGEFDRRGRLMEGIPVQSPRGGPRTSAIRRFDPTNAKWDTIPVPQCSFPDGGSEQRNWSYHTATGGGVIGVPFAPWPVSRMDPSGAWWCGSAVDYHLQLKQLEGGRVLADVRRSDPRVPIPPRVRDSVVAEYQTWSRKVPPGTIDVSRIPRTYPRFQSLEVDDRGRLWAWRHTAGGTTIDVWSRAGVQAATLEWPSPHNASLRVIVRGDRLYVVISDDDGVPFVVRYKVIH